MPLTTENLVLLQSNRLDDTSDGGGMMTGTALQSGRANNLFPDVSHLDKTTGRVSLRKVFAGVASDDSQPFYGAHVILQNDASDPLIDVCLLRANAWAETRADIRTRMQGDWVPSDGKKMGVTWAVENTAGIEAGATKLTLSCSAFLRDGRPPALSAAPIVGEILIHRFNSQGGGGGGGGELSFAQSIKTVGSVVRVEAMSQGGWIDSCAVTIDPFQFSTSSVFRVTATEVVAQATAQNTGSLRGDGFRAVGVATLTTAAAAGDKKLLIDRMAASICPPSYPGFDAAIVGLDLDKMPPSGRVDLWRAGDVIVLHDTAVTSVATPVAGSTTATRAGLSAVVVEDAAGREVYSDRYSIDLATGVLTWANPLNLVGFLGPYSVRHTRDEMALVSVVDTAAASLSLAVPLQKAWPANAQVSGSLLLGDLVAGFSPPFEQGAWTGEWSNTVIGQAIAAQYNTAQYPLTLTNRGAIAERWRIDFTNATTVKIIGESVGVVAEGVSINADVAPLNPATGTPYFSIDRRGWGSGWNAGNQLRFNTSAGKSPFWLSRATLQGVVGPATDSVRIQLRGDTDV